MNQFISQENTLSTTRRMKQRQLKQPAAPAPGSPALRPTSAPTTWGTRQRMAAEVANLDQGSLDHLLDK
eukprot:scaffold42739_cov39-Phaeocystis_antarctica.AAC.1